MYVRKFEADTIDDALKAIKRELGPDAIILKTISNRGLKSAFKKSKFEITAAIKEENYRQKIKVDKVLSNDQRESFYRSPAKDISSMINSYEKPNQPKANYGSLGLNKVVKSNKTEGESTLSKVASSLDDFLNFSDNSNDDNSTSSRLDAYFDNDNTESEVTHSHSEPVHMDQSLLLTQMNAQKEQIRALEKKLSELNQNMLIQNNKVDPKNHSISEVVNLLRSFNIKDSLIGGIIKKAQFELKESEISNLEALYEFALREIANSINTELPLFSRVNLHQESVITVLLNETSSGQTAIATKLAVMQENVDILVYGNANQQSGLAQKLFNINMIPVNSLAEIISACRKAQKENRSIIIDVKDTTQNDSSAKNLVDSLKRTFDNIEVLVTCSALHGETFNGKILSKYKTIANGVIITHVDMCLDFGAILNVHAAHADLPLKFFGTGPVIPEDIEAATAERIVASLFKL